VDLVWNGYADEPDNGTNEWWRYAAETNFPYNQNEVTMSQLTDAILAVDQSAQAFETVDAGLVSANNALANAQATAAAHQAADAAAISTAQQSISQAQAAEEPALQDLQAKTAALQAIVAALLNPTPAVPVVPPVAPTSPASGS
jgi:hypothetical protein